MKTIYKYELKRETGTQSMQLPKDVEILRLSMQQFRPVIHAIVDTDESEKEIVVFHTFYTGRPIPKDINMMYFDTYYVGSTVYHVFIEYLSLV